MLNQLLSMGGYGIYVWPAYGITLLVFAINFFLDIRERNRVQKIVKHYLIESSRSS